MVQNLDLSIRQRLNKIPSDESLNFEHKKQAADKIYDIEQKSTESKDSNERNHLSYDYNSTVKRNRSADI